MATKKKIQYNDYADYLKSPAWEQIKSNYKISEDTRTCTCCSVEFDQDVKPNYHHFRYPKDWNNDTYENLIIVCEACHALLHIEIEHDSNHLTLRAYMRRVVDVYSSYYSQECQELEDYELAVVFNKGKAAVVCDQHGLPREIEVNTSIRFINRSIASKLLKIQRHGK